MSTGIRISIPQWYDKRPSTPSGAHVWTLFQFHNGTIKGGKRAMIGEVRIISIPQWYDKRCTTAGCKEKG